MTNNPELTDKQIEQIRRDVAKAYHDLMIDLAMKGEGVVGRRRFWKDENNVIRYEDLPEGVDGDTNAEDLDGDSDSSSTSGAQ